MVILRGMVASGKTTTLKNLRKNKKTKGWIIIDFNKLKRQFEHLGDEKRKAYGKIALFSILKNLMQTKKNIVFDEMSKEGVKKNLSHYLEKYNYEIIVFEFTVDLRKAVKREAERRNTRNLKPKGKKWVKKMHEERPKKYGVHSKGIIVNTSHLNQKQVVNFILKKVR